MRRLFVTMMFALAIGMGASAALASNQTEANKIAQELGAKYPQYNIEVAYQEGKVRLRGNIATETERAEITRYVEQMPQVKSVSEIFTIVSSVEKPLVGKTSTPSSYLPIATGSNGSVIDQGNVLSVAAEKPVLATPKLRTEDSENVQLKQPVVAPMQSKVAAKSQMAEFPAIGVPVAENNINMLPVPKVGMTVEAPAVPAMNVSAQAAPVAAPAPAPAPAPVAVQPAMTAPIQNLPNSQPANDFVVDGRGRPLGTPIGAAPVAARPYPEQAYGNQGPQGQPIVPGQTTQPNMPGYAWPSYANYPNYSQVSYPKQYGAGAFPYMGPFYPYPQVPLGWRKVTMEWHDGYWWLDFNDGSNTGPFSPLFRQPTKYR